MTVPSAGNVGLATLAAVTGGNTFAGSPKVRLPRPVHEHVLRLLGKAALRSKWADSFYANYNRAAVGGDRGPAERAV